MTHMKHNINKTPLTPLKRKEIKNNTFSCKTMKLTLLNRKQIAPLPPSKNIFIFFFKQKQKNLSAANYNRSLCVFSVLDFGLLQTEKNKSQIL